MMMMKRTVHGVQNITIKYHLEALLGNSMILVFLINDLGFIQHTKKQKHT